MLGQNTPGKLHHPESGADFFHGWFYERLNVFVEMCNQSEVELAHSNCRGISNSLDNNTRAMGVLVFFISEFVFTSDVDRVLVAASIFYAALIIVSHPES